MVRRHIFLPAKLDTVLCKAAKREGIAVSELVRRAIQALLAKPAK